MRILFRFVGILFALIAMRAAQAEPCQMLLVGKLPVTVTHGRVLIDGAIGGKPVKFILDTGAGVTLMDSKIIRDFGAVTRDARRHAYGFNGEAAIRIADVPDFQLGTYHAGTISLHVLTNTTIDPGVYGLIGEDFLSHFDVEFDLADNVINLFVPGHCAEHQVYWSSQFSTAQIDFPSSSDKHIQISVELNGHRMTALLDSGCQTSFVADSRASYLGYDPASPSAPHLGYMRGLDGKRENVTAIRFDNFSIADEQIAHPLLAVSRIFGAREEQIGSHIAQSVFDADMVLGLDFIKAHRFLIDYENAQMYFDYLGGPVFLPGNPKPAETTAADPQTSK